MPIISLIAAIDENSAIGYDGDMLCYIPSDLKRFKAITSGHMVIMGRKTFESLPNGALPDRRNIVISKNESFNCKDCEVTHSIEAAIELSKNEDEVFIIGGGELYKQIIGIADKLYITQIRHKFEKADTYFPEIKKDEWTAELQEVYKEQGDEYEYVFTIYSRKS